MLQRNECTEGGSMTVLSKRELRRMLRGLRGSQQERDAQSEAISRHILDSDIFRHADIIAGYAALPHEADIAKVLETALLQGKTVVMPRCGSAPQMTLHQITSLADLRAGKYGIPEPLDSSPAFEAKDVSLILVPLEGIDNDGYRLGKGGGYYDCLLGKTEAYSMGCALTWQHVENMPLESWDKPLSACADVHGIYEFKR